jgi:KipI family sensor histidine kinase inhibitor
MPYGESAVLIELPDLESVLNTYSHLQQEKLPGVVDLVPAARTLLVHLDPAVADLRRLEQAVQDPAATRQAPRPGPLVEVPVVYDGEDLEDVARHVGLPVAEVVHRHSGGEYLAAFCGFVPGFAYLTGVDARLQVPRLPSPRVAVPAGSVALADQFTAIYPRQSPGGWRLIGHTGLDLFDVHREPPALLSPMTRVRFRPVSR